MKTTTTTQTATELLETVKKFHTARIVKAVQEFPKYRLMPNGDLVNMENGEVYTATRWNSAKGWVGCSCPDATTRVQKLRDTMTAAGVTAPCACKHRAIRQLLNGESVRIGSSVFTARKKK